MLAPLSRLDDPKRLVASFVLLLLLPAAGVVWMGLRTIAQDRALESQLRERRENAADRLLGVLERSVSNTERTLKTPPDNDSLYLTIDGDTVEAHPRERLLYYPGLDSFENVEPFSQGEQLENLEHDYTAAKVVFRNASKSSNAEIRAGALLRLARNLRHEGALQEALNVYRDLAQFRDVRLDGVPADLAARRAICTVLQEPGHSIQLQEESKSLQKDLFAGRWKVDRGTFFDYAEETSPPAAEALAEAVDWLWHNRSASRRSVEVQGTTFVVFTRAEGGRTSALIAGPSFQQREWFLPLEAQIDPRELQVALISAGDQVVTGKLPEQVAFTARRSLGDTNLPWTLLVSNVNATAEIKALTLRQRMMEASLAALVLLLVGGGYFTIRAVSRELAVARLQSDFVAAVSHEFRTPLTSLRQFTDLLNEDDLLPIEKRRVFHQAQARAADRLHRLVESLLDFRRMEAGARPFKKRCIPAEPFVRAVVEDFQREAPSGFRIESLLAADAGSVDADSEAMGRALWNLLDNAVKYSGDSKRIWVDLNRNNGSVALRVRDSGLGIPRHEQRKIFRKFVRGADALTNGINGTGIGLAMVQHIVDAHGGTVRVESSPGEGSTFTITLPGKDC